MIFLPYLAFWLAVGILHEYNPAVWVYGVLTSIFMLLSIGLSSQFFFSDDPYDQDQAPGAAENPWMSQLKLMQISGQEIPEEPRLTGTSILYGALIMEEAGETFTALSKVIEYQSEGRNSDLYKIACEFARYGESLQNRSKLIRILLAETQEVPRPTPIPLDMAIECLDGITDIHVVTIGLGVSMGLPGDLGYDQVVGSNLSKANPMTGAIDKTPDGKWIKGELYVEPDLASVVLSKYKSAAHARVSGI